MDVKRQDPIRDITLSNVNGIHSIEVKDRDDVYVKRIRRFEHAGRGEREKYSAGADGMAVTCEVAVLVTCREKRTVAIKELSMTQR